ncbi:glutathione peroxidase [Lacrimispora algidixylanolytica]|uniref:Glutathione peroxidase n=1 Tax=Lacrimispora algidixylanolytica TaxID=94868 RepID=A0A419T791_9FIRM|nr:glutathione peroxidase [Lacrimispora algidixylanolytica]RKD33305.1 glutathione peroxidase [Lacrimispora algidixylanolytica]
MSVYDFKVKTMNGEEKSLSDYEGKVLLITNTATECGFTPQYTDLQEIYSKYADKGLEILDFPCNQFGNQAPGENDEIHTFCTGRFGVTFPQFSKIDVNGENAIPLYQYLVKEKDFNGFDAGHNLTPILEKKFDESNPNYKNEPDIKWNFTKFLVDKNGNVVRRFEPTADMKLVEESISELLK